MKALVLGGGGVKGAYEIGALQHLILDLNRRYDILCGVSVGALNVGFLSMFNDNNLAEGYLQLLQMWTNIKTSDIYKRWCPFGRLSALWKNSLYDSSPLQKLVRSNLDLGRVRQSGKQVAVGAVSLTSGEYKIFTQKDDTFVDGVIASSAFPAFLTPITINGELFTDGGVKEITPIKAAIDLGATSIDIVMCSPIKSSGGFNRNAKTPAIAMRTIDLMSDEILYNDIKTAMLYNELVKNNIPCNNKRHVDMTLVCPEQPLPVDSLDFDHERIMQMIEWGYEDAIDLTKQLINDL